jgi:lysozyme family protein
MSTTVKGFPMMPLIANSFAGMTPVVLQFDDTKNDQAAGENFQTAYGVTEYTWANAINEGIVPNKPLSQATRDECLMILRADYFNRCRIIALPAGPNLQVYHTALLSGAGHAAALLNRIVGAVGTAVTVDTIRRANSFPGGAPALIEALYVADETFLAALANAPKYIHGWDRAEDVMRAAAYAMLGINEAPAPTQLPRILPARPAQPAPVSIAAHPDDTSADDLNAAELTRIS